MIVADTGYPESVLSPEQFELFREATLHALDKEPASNWPRYETSSWRIVRHERPQEASATGGLKHLLIVQVPESQARALAGLNDRPFYHLG